jgi:DNA-binding transcriptional LysR family regulator
LRDAELAEDAIRHRLTEPTGTVRCTAAMATVQFAIGDILASFLVLHPKINVVAHATDRNVDIVGENYDVAIRAHSEPLPIQLSYSGRLRQRRGSCSLARHISMRTERRKPPKISGTTLRSS